MLESFDAHPPGRTQAIPPRVSPGRECALQRNEGKKDDTTPSYDDGTRGHRVGAGRSAEDKAGVAQIRKHFEHIHHAFQTGDFAIPMFVHDQTPPGVPAMKKLKNKIQYKYEELEGGARISITSRNAEAIDAIHQFLRFQIEEHETGDPLELK